MSLRRLLCWLEGHRWYYGIWNYREFCRDGDAPVTGRRCTRCAKLEEKP